MVSQDHRVEKLEAGLFAALSPEDRVREFLKAQVDGNENLAWRIADLCPRSTYEITDPAYTGRLRNIFVIGLTAVGTFEKYAYAYYQVEKMKNLMVKHEVAAIMPSDFHSLMVDAITKGGNGEKIGWDHLKEVGEKLHAGGSALLVRWLTAWQTGLEQQLRAEWRGFDAFCRSELHLDAFTLLRGLKLGMTKDFFIEESARAERPTDASDSEGDKEVRELAGEIEASWRESFRSLDNSRAKRFKSGVAYGT